MATYMKDIYSMQQLEESILAWENFGQIDPKKEKKAVEWFETIPEEAILYGKRLTMRSYNKIPHYSPEYWEERPEAEFQEHLQRLNERRKEIKEENDTRNLLAMFVSPVVRNMMVKYPSIRENCPDFILDGIRRDIIDLSISTFCYWDDLVENLLGF